MDDIDAELAFVLAYCKTSDQVNRQIAKHATIVQKLLCRVAQEDNKTEDEIRKIYASFADMAVEQLKDPRHFTAHKPH